MARAESCRLAAHAATVEAAEASAMQDAHNLAAGFAYTQAHVAEGTEAELRSMLAGSEAPAPGSAKNGEAAAAAARAAIPHEGVGVQHRSLTGVGRALTTAGPNAAARIDSIAVPKA
jgi:hypothetical protein